MEHTNKVRELRLARAWSQEHLAEISGLSTRTVQRIENGEQPSLETLSALAAVFNLSIAELSGSETSCDDALDQRITDARTRVADESRFYRSVITGVIACSLMLVLHYVMVPSSAWPLWVAGIWCLLLVVRGMRVFLFSGLISRWQQKRLQQILRR